MSDHYVLTPYADTDAGEWSMPLDRLGEYVEDVLATRRDCVQVRLGVEADYFPETWEALRERLAPVPFDYVIGSVHYANDFPIDASADYWSPLGQDEVDEIYRIYWVRIRQLAECGVFDFVGHLDLPKKFGFRPQTDLSRERTEALDAIAAANLAVELNTAGWDKPCAECYPSLELLREVNRRNIPVLVSADAHAPEKAAAHYPCAAEILWRAGFRETVRFERRERIAVPLMQV
jgi:histidinol-phosphatase (PHP family)